LSSVSSSAIRLSLASMSDMIIFYQIIRKTKSKKGVNGYNYTLLRWIGNQVDNSLKKGGCRDSSLGEKVGGGGCSRNVRHSELSGTDLP